MASALKTIFQILTGGLVASGAVVSGVVIKNKVDMGVKENNRSWFNQSAVEDDFYDKFEISSYNQEDVWKERYEYAKKDYDFDKAHKQINYSLDHMEKGWERFRDFCFSGLSDLKSENINPSDYSHSSRYGEWTKKWEYWPWCINVKYAPFEQQKAFTDTSLSEEADS